MISMGSPKTTWLLENNTNGYYDAKQLPSLRLSMALTSYQCEKCALHDFDDIINGFLLDSGNSEDLASMMKLFGENPDLCRQMGKAGRKKALREYSEDAYYERLMSAYQRAIEMNKENQQYNCLRTTGLVM